MENEYFDVLDNLKATEEKIKEEFEDLVDNDTKSNYSLLTDLPIIIKIIDARPSSTPRPPKGNYDVFVSLNNASSSIQIPFDQNKQIGSIPSLDDITTFQVSFWATHKIDGKASPFDTKTINVAEYRKNNVIKIIVLHGPQGTANNRTIIISQYPNS